MFPMLCEDKALKLIEIFIACDDFANAYQRWKAQYHPNQKPGPDSQLAPSEVMTILIFYHYSGAKCFQYYYRDWVQGPLRSYFPCQVSYERFVSELAQVGGLLFLLLKYQCAHSERTGFYIVDSKALAVCDNHRIKTNQVFAGIAARGKSSMGWFYGLKAHLVINQYGQLVNFVLTPGNVADNNGPLLRSLLTDLQGQCFGDRGYLTRLFAEFYQNGLQIVTKLRRGMKNTLMPLSDKLNLRKRGLIESVNDLLTSVFDIEHTRHRNPLNAIVNIVAGLSAYCFADCKPSIVVPEFKRINL